MKPAVVLCPQCRAEGRPRPFVVGMVKEDGVHMMLDFPTKKRGDDRMDDWDNRIDDGANRVDAFWCERVDTWDDPVAAWGGPGRPMPSGPIVDASEGPTAELPLGPIVDAWSVRHHAVPLGPIVKAWGPAGLSALCRYHDQVQIPGDHLDDLHRRVRRGDRRQS